MAQTQSTRGGELMTFGRRSRQPIDQIRLEFADLIDRLFSGYGMGSLGRGSLGSLGSLMSGVHGYGHVLEGGYIPVDIIEDQQQYRIEAEVPGLREQDIEVTCTPDNTLTIRGRRQQQTEDAGQNYMHSERSQGQSVRILHLPQDAEAERITANYNQGVLTITVPKSQETTRQQRRIQITSGGQSGSGSSTR